MTTRHDLLFELFAVLRCGHNTDFTSHVRLNLFFVTVHKTCSTPYLPKGTQITTHQPYHRRHRRRAWGDAPEQPWDGSPHTKHTNAYSLLPPLDTKQDRFKEDSDTSPDPEDRGLTDSQEVGDHHLGQVLTKDQQAGHHLTPQGIQHLNRSIPRPSITSATRQVISSIVSSQNPFVDW